jgi:hypothetical protein
VKGHQRSSTAAVPAKAIADIEAGLAAEAKRRHARNRY